MDKGSLYAAVIGLGVALATGGCADTTSAAAPKFSFPALSSPGFDEAWVQQDGVLYHVPHYLGTIPRPGHRVRHDTVVNYYGGTVLVTPIIYVTFWNYKAYGDPDGVKALLETYFRAMGGSSHNNIETQYYEVSSGTTIFITNPAKQYGGAWDDEADKIPRHPTDAQIAAEAVKAVAHFGYNPDASYVIATAHGRSTKGFGTQWCGYHSAIVSSDGVVPYTNLPYTPDAGGNCGADLIGAPRDEKAIDEGVTIVEGAEFGQVVTDPVPGEGWFNYQGGEIGDLCGWQNIKNDRFGKHLLTMQAMFSNASQSCVQSYK